MNGILLDQKDKGFSGFYDMIDDLDDFVGDEEIRNDMDDFFGVDVI